MGNITSQQAEFNRCPLQYKAAIATSSPFQKALSSGDTHNLFTAEEKRLIRKTWSQLQHQQQTAVSDGRKVDGTGSHNANRGVRVFLRIFELEPEAQSVFSDFRHVSQPSELIANPVFRSHAKRFMTAVDMTVHSLDALDVIVAPTLVRLGRRHVEFAGFHLRYMVIFERAMDDTWRTDLGRRRYSGATRHAWRKLFHFLTSRVTEGYDGALAELTAVVDSGRTPSQSANSDLICPSQDN